MQTSILSDFWTLVGNQPPFYQAVSYALVAMLLIIFIGVGEFAVLSAVREIRRFRARRYFNKVVRIEQAEIRRRHLDAVARSRS